MIYFPLNFLCVSKFGYIFALRLRNKYKTIKIMKFSELAKQVQERLVKEKNNLHSKNINTSYEVLVYNEAGSRFLNAKRVQGSWQNNRGSYMPFGGGSKWILRYGEVGFQTYRNPFGEMDAELCMGRLFSKSSNGTSIPKSVGTKREVLAIIDQIGIF